jgi:hypothetical protein
MMNARVYELPLQQRRRDELLPAVREKIRVALKEP